MSSASSQQPAPVRTLGLHPLPVLAVAVSPDGTTSASASGTTEDGLMLGQVRLWDLASGRLLRVLTARRGVLYSVAFSPDGSLIAAGNASGNALLWDARSGALKHELSTGSGPVRALAFSPDGRTLAAAGARSDELHLWDATTGASKAAMTAHAGGVMALAWSRGGEWIATLGRDRKLKIWKGASGVLTTVIEGVVDRGLCVAFAPDGSTVAIGGGDVMIVNVSTGKASTLARHVNTVSSLVYSPDGRSFVTTTGEPDVVPGGVEKIAGLPEFQVAIDGGGAPLAATRAGLLRVFDAARGTVIRELSAVTDFVWSAAYAPDGKTLVTGSADGSVRVWRLEP